MLLQGISKMLHLEYKISLGSREIFIKYNNIPKSNGYSVSKFITEQPGMIRTQANVIQCNWLYLGDHLKLSQTKLLLNQQSIIRHPKPEMPLVKNNQIEEKCCASITEKQFYLNHGYA